jgi:type III secretion protein J
MHALLHRFTTAALVALAAALAGCSEQELYSQLSERQANEMVAVLRSAGLAGDKVAQEGGRFAVVSSRSDFPAAVRTLSAQGYPREQFDSMGKVFKREGFVSSPLEERARLVHAMSQEIANTINNIDGVVTARVHLVVPERNPLADKPQPAAASVFIKHRPDRDLTGQMAQIKALVVNSIEGLPYENVTVALFPAENLPAEAKPASATVPGVPAARRNNLEAPLMSSAGIGALALSGGGLLWWRRRRTPAGSPLQSLGVSLPPALRSPGKPNLSEEMQAALRRAAERK